MNKIIEFIKNKNCPWCNQKLNSTEIFILSAYTPTQCKNCNNFYVNSKINDFLSVITPFILILVPVIWFDLNAIFLFSLSFLLPFFKNSLTEPLKYGTGKTNYFCIRCKRAKIVYRNSTLQICENCLKTGEKRASPQTSSRQERKLKPTQHLDRSKKEAKTVH